MTGDECAQVVNLLVSSFPTGPKGHAWTDSIAHLHAGPAMSAARQLARDTDRPTIAQFHAAYHAHLANARQARADERGAPAVCQLCDGTGWVERVDDRRHAPFCKHPGTKYADPGDCHCHAVDPCRCNPRSREQ